MIYEEISESARRALVKYTDSLVKSKIYFRITSESQRHDNLLPNHRGTRPLAYDTAFHESARG